MDIINDITVYDTVLAKSKTSVINTLYVTIENTFNNDFSILANDDMGDIWQEKFAPTYEQAMIIATKMHNKILSTYNK